MKHYVKYINKIIGENNKSQIKVVYSDDIVTFKNYAYEKNLYLFYHNQVE